MHFNVVKIYIVNLLIRILNVRMVPTVSVCCMVVFYGEGNLFGKEADHV